MNKVLLVGMATMVAFNMSIANAAITHAADVRKAVTEENKRALDKGALDGISDVSVTAKINSMSDRLVGLARNADTKEFSDALTNHKVRINENGQAKEVSMVEIGSKLLMAKQSLDKINRNDLDAQGQAHYDQMRQALETSAQFMTLGAKSADLNKVMDTQTQKQVDAFNKQLSLIPDLLGMDTRELKSHVDIMQSAVQAKTSPNVTGEEAYYAALKAKYGDKANAKLDEILGCAR